MLTNIYFLKVLIDLLDLEKHPYSTWTEIILTCLENHDNTSFSEYKINIKLILNTKFKVTCLKVDSHKKQLFFEIFLNELSYHELAYHRWATDKMFSILPQGFTRMRKKVNRKKRIKEKQYSRGAHQWMSRISKFECEGGLTGEKGIDSFWWIEIR